MNPQFDPKTIETLKAARNQVVQADPAPEQVPMESRILDRVGTRYGANKNSQAHSTFAEEFVQKLAAIDQEMATVDEEIAKLEKIWVNLTEKKKQLENRREKLIKVRDKLKELDKEMTDFLSKRSEL